MMLECGNTVAFKVTQQYWRVAQGPNPAESAVLAQLWVGAKVQANSFVGWGKQDLACPLRGSGKVRAAACYAQVLYFSTRETKGGLCWEQTESWLRGKIYFVLYVCYGIAYQPFQFPAVLEYHYSSLVAGKQSP